ncbi:unnamed protein product [Symbiodinium sp. CCMP2456]|nr:unnamed protein product [Symbiodinium sp. CCMP2456]
MMVLDTMLGQSSCLSGSSSTCAYRCFYNSDDDKCGPAAFCMEVAEGEMPSPLAPFGDQQKCKAVGGSSHEAADEALASEAIPALKSMALDVAQRLEDMDAVSASSAGLTTMKQTAQLWAEAAEVLQVLETLPARTDAGKFAAAQRRGSKTDIKHWRRRKDRLTTAEYNAAKEKPIEFLQDSTEFSVAAKPHSVLVSFVLKRPRIMIETAKMQSKDQCLLKDGTKDEKNQLEEFVKYFLNVPGYNRGDLDGQTLSLPEHCQEYLRTRGDTPTADLLSKADQAKQYMKEEVA